MRGILQVRDLAMAPLPEATRRYSQQASKRLLKNPRDLSGLFVRATVMASLGRHEEAIRALDALGQLSPHYPGLWRFKARLHRDVGNDRLADSCIETAEREEASEGILDPG